MSKKLYSQFKYQNRVICLPFDKKIYYDIVKDANKFRASLDEFIKQFPQLFPAEIKNWGTPLFTFQLFNLLIIKTSASGLPLCGQGVRPFFEVVGSPFA